jgi:arylsulfatase A-like enzyme
MNILLITIYTSRYDFVGYDRGFRNSLTPNIDEISKEGLINHYVSISWTATSLSFLGFCFRCTLSKLKFLS